LLLVTCYFFYGLPWGWHYQWLSFQVNTHKIMDVVSWLRLFTDQSGAAINSFAFFFYPLMLFNLFLVSPKLDKFSQLITSTYLILMGALIYGTGWGFFGWYKTALYPFLAIGMGVSVSDLISGSPNKINYLKGEIIKLNERLKKQR